MNSTDYTELVSRALAEDLDGVGDLTSECCVPGEATAEASIVARAAGVIAGLEVAAHVFEMVDESVRLVATADDGDRVEAGRSVAEVDGPARSLLAAERSALNILGRMSGVATATRLLVDAVSGLNVLISDTRKTMPGMRVLDKYSVRMGGGVNHRFGLYDAVMIKDNHIAAAGDIIGAVASARNRVGPGVMIVVEIDSLQQLEEVLATDADRVLLDNMGLETMTTAVEMVGGRMTTEASGGIRADRIREVAETGVDVISVGWITHSAPQLDLGLDFRS